MVVNELRVNPDVRALGHVLAAGGYETGYIYLWIDGFEWRSLRDKRYTYAVYRRDGKEHLYDNVEDPLQKVNRAGVPSFKARLAEFRGRLAERRRELQDPFQACTWDRDHWTDGNRNVLRGAKG
jgi:arylsulfatase A-like enzyme